MASARATSAASGRRTPSRSSVCSTPSGDGVVIRQVLADAVALPRQRFWAYGVGFVHTARARRAFSRKLMLLMSPLAPLAIARRTGDLAGPRPAMLESDRKTRRSNPPRHPCPASADVMERVVGQQSQRTARAGLHGNHAHFRIGRARRSDQISTARRADSSAPGHSFDRRDSA
jgi:hypothetical protein